MILLAGLLLRLVYFFHIQDAVLLQRPFLDADFYHRWAIEIAGGDWAGANRGAFGLSPGYAYFLAIIYSVIGVHITAVVFIQLLLGVACGWMVYLLGEKHLSRDAGLLAAALFLFYSPELFFESTLLKACLINVVNTGALLAASAASPIGWVLSGSLIGYSAQLRPTAMLLVPPIALWLGLRTARGWRACLLFACGLAAILLPVAARNFAVGGEWVWTTTHGGLNLYSAYNPENRGPYEKLSFARPDPDYEPSDFLREARRRTGQALTPAQSSDFWYGEAWRFIREQPLRAATLLWRKALIFFNGYEVPINQDYYSFRKEYGSALSLPLVSFTILLGLGMVGMLRATPNLLLLGYLAAVFASNVVFLGASEYRFPVVPVLCLYGGWAIHRCLRDIEERSARKVALWAAVSLILFVFSSGDIYGTVLGMPRYTADTEAKAFYNLAIEYKKAGFEGKALDLYLESERLNPADAETQNNLGISLAGRGRFAEAIRHFEKALPHLPGEASRNLLKARIGLARQLGDKAQGLPSRPDAKVR